MEQLYSQGRVEVRLLPPDKVFLPRKFKVCADVEIPGQQAIENLTDSDKTELGREVAQLIADICPGQGSILVTIDAVREGVVNVGVYTNSRSDIRALRDAERIYPQFAYDISDPRNPRPIPDEECLKK